MTTVLRLLIAMFTFFTMVVLKEPQTPPQVLPKEEQEWQEAEPEEDYGEGLTEYEKRLNELTDGHTYTDSWGELVPDPMYMPQPDFGTMPENSLFLPGWVTEDGNFILGSVAVVRVNDELPCVGLTAFHCLNVLREVGGMELPDYIQGGVLFDVDHPNEIVASEVTKMWAMPNAESLSYGKDLAAFEPDDLSEVNVLPLAEGTCEQGEVIYLYGELVSEDEDIIETRLYPCVVTYDDGTEIQYVLSEEFDTSGASGSPLLNNQGEVVGIHIGSAGSIRSGHSAESIRERLTEAYEYNK